MNDGLYIEASVHGIGLNCLIDSGSTITVIRPSIINQLATEIQLDVVSEDGELKMADGSLMATSGKTEIPFQINGMEYRQVTTIADIDAPVVLGYDFLHHHKCQVDFENSLLQINNLTFPCKLESQLQV